MPVGKPPKWTDPDAMQAAIDEYFDYCDNRIKKKYDKKTEDVVEYMDPAPYTVSGLARALGFTSTRSLWNYGNSKEEHYKKFHYIIKMAYMRIQESLEQRSLESGNAAGPIFNLKVNFGMKEEQTIHHEIPGGFKILWREGKGKENDVDS